MKRDLLLCLDIGGTACKFGCLRLDPDHRQLASKQVLARAELTFQGDRQIHPLLEQISSYLPSYLDQVRQAGLDPAELAGVAISATGQIDTHLGQVVGTCGNFPGWLSTPLKDFFEDYFACPTSVANDANCMVLGESWQGRGQGYKNLIGITLGTGVGGGLIIDSKLVSGQRGLAGELGHLPIFGPTGKACTCGLHGCIEQYVSTTALIKRARAQGFNFANARELCAHLFTPSAEPQSGHQAADPDLARVWSAWLADLAYALAGLVHLFNPDCILIGGGISEQGDRLVLPLRQELEQLIMPQFKQGLQVELAALGNAAGLYGAAKFWIDESSLR